VPELCWASSLIFVGNDLSFTAFTDEGGEAELRHLDIIGVDAAKIKLELIEFQQNVAAKYIFLDGTPENFLPKEYISKIFRPLTICQWKFLLFLVLPDAARGVNCTLLHATGNAKLGPQLSLYLGFSNLLVFSIFLRFSKYFSVI